jgi:putative transposase
MEPSHCFNRSPIVPRQPRFCPAGYPVHVIQRGVNRQVCFGEDADMAAYANWLREAAERYGLAVHAWVLMTNHVHLLLTPTSDTAISLCMQYLGRHYVRHFNFRYRRTGTLFEGRFKSSLIQSDAYLIACQRYIELNPVRASLVSDPGDYVWSSYRCHALGRDVRMWSPHTLYLELGRSATERTSSYRKMFGQELNAHLIEDIRFAAHTGLVLGTERFRCELEQLKLGSESTLTPR